MRQPGNLREILDDAVIDGALEPDDRERAFLIADELVGRHAS